ncbi:MAG: LCP family protein [Elusimicrobia bacterium]|nr:LCP family protein [Elusimicrobiota bacterium]
MKFNKPQLLLFLTVLFLIFSIYLSFSSYFSQSIKNSKSVNAVLMVSSPYKNLRHLEFLIFVNYVPSQGYLNLIPIPKEARIPKHSKTVTTLEKVFDSSCKSEKNMHVVSRRVIKEIEDIFQNKSAIPNYVAFDLVSLERLIDIMGGITLDIDEPVNKKDENGNLTVFLSTGSYRLNASDTLEYVRLMNTSSRADNALRKQLFLKAFLKKISSPALFFKMPWIIPVINSNLESNLNPWDLMFGFFELKNIKRENIQVFQMPGHFKGAYFEPDNESIKGLFDKLFPSKDISLYSGPKVRLEVWNASGKNNLAEKITWILREKGYDVVEWGTFSVKQKKTLIKDLSGDLKTAQKISNIISCGEIVTRYEAKRYIDISLILGEDCKIE